jgi:hypothetical protein
MIVRVFLAAELAGVEQLDKVGLEVDRLGPSSLVSIHQIGDGSGAHFALDKPPGVIGHFCT